MTGSVFTEDRHHVQELLEQQALPAAGEHPTQLDIERIDFQLRQLQQFLDVHPTPGIVDVVHLLQQGRRQQLGEPAAAAEQEIDWR